MPRKKANAITRSDNRAVQPELPQQRDGAPPEGAFVREGPERRQQIEVVKQPSEEDRTRIRERRELKHKETTNYWRSMGFYNRHPNESPADPAIITESNLKKKMKKHDNLGPIAEKYKLLINPSKKRVMLLQYPNREPGQAYCDETGQKPLELRIKPKCGLVEVDVPMNVHSNFDKEKGLEYGAALRKSRLMQKGGSYGLAGGLGIGPTKASKNETDATVPEGPLHEKLLENYDDANNKGHVMNKITLGGRIIPFKDGDPIYMIATFKGGICTWTKLDVMVQLRPQFNHLDALHEQDKSVARYERVQEEKGAENKAEDVNMVVKDTDNNESLDMYGGMNETSKLLRAMRDEPWQYLSWIDQEDPRSYEAYEDTLVYQNPETAPLLISEMTNEQYLDAISCPRNDPIAQGKKVMRAADGRDDSSSEEETEGEDDEEESKTHQEPPTAEHNVSSHTHPNKHWKDGVEYEWVPVGCPTTRQREMWIERTCRSICLAPKHERRKYEYLIRQKHGRDPRFAFLSPSDFSHNYFRWRLEENEAGGGIPPDFEFTDPPNK